MRCPKCNERMSVSTTTTIGRVTIRYLRCPLCGNNEQSIETFRERKPKSETTCSVKVPKSTV